MELQFYTNNITWYLGILVFYIQVYIIINEPLSSSMKLFLQVNYRQIAIILTKTLLFKLKQSNLQSQQNLYSYSCIPPQTHNQDPLITLIDILNPPKFLHHLHHLCSKANLTPHSKKYLLDLI